MLNTETTQDGTSTETVDSGKEKYQPKTDRISDALNSAKQMIEHGIEPTIENKLKVQEEQAKEQQKAEDTVGIHGLAKAKMEEALYNTSHSGLDYNKVLAELPDDAKKLLANFRSDYTRKTQEIAQMKKALAAERDTLLNSDFVKNINEKAAQTVEFDAFDEKSIEARIEQEVAKRMQQMVKPLQQQYELQQNQIQLDQFKANHPDLMDMKQDVAKLLISNKELSLQQAYFIVKGQKQNQKTQSLQEELQQYKSAAKEYGLKVGGSRRGVSTRVPDNIKKAGAYAVYQWLETNKSNKKSN